jgi:predicted ester cyclase
MTHDEAPQIIKPLYDALNHPGTKDVAALAGECLAERWRSFNSNSTNKTREEFVAQVIGFGKAIPDLTWKIEEVLVDGNRIVVRSEVTGTPSGPFMGVQPTGKKFSIMAIDIHTVSEGKIDITFHVEDWAGAVRQLSAK